MDFLELAELYAQGKISANDPKMAEAEKLLKEMASTEDGRDEIAETIAIFIDKTFHEFDIAPMITENRNFALGDKPEFRLRKKGVKAYWIAPNSYTPKSRNYMETLTMEFDSLSVRPECLIDELKAGRIQGFAELVTDARDAMRRAIAGKVFTILGQVYNETQNPDQYELVSGSTLTESAVKAGIDQVVYKTGKQPILLGDYKLVKQITGFTGYSTDNMKDEIRKTGKLGVYYGSQLVYLPECIDPATGTILVPQKRLYIVSSKVGYSGTYGEAKFGQETNINDWSWNARIDKEWGMTVTQPEGIYVVEVE